MKIRLPRVLLTLLLMVCFVFGGQMPSQTSAIAATAELQVLHDDLGKLYQQAFTATEAGQFPEAEELWGLAIERMPENPATWSNRGNTRISQLKLKEAIKDFDQSIAIAPDQPGAYVNRGIALEGLKDWDRAIADYNQALDLDPNDAITLNNRGNAKGGSGDWDAAKQDFMQASDLEPGLAIARINTALAQFQLGEKEEAMLQIKKLVRKYPMTADTRAASTAMLWNAGHFGEAESNWVSAVGIDPRYKQLDWVANIRRWPPAMVDALGHFLDLSY